MRPWGGAASAPRRTPGLLDRRMKIRSLMECAMYAAERGSAAPEVHRNLRLRSIQPKNRAAALPPPRGDVFGVPAMAFVCAHAPHGEGHPDIASLDSAALRSAGAMCVDSRNSGSVKSGAVCLRPAKKTLRTAVSSWLIPSCPVRGSHLKTRVARCIVKVKGNGRTDV
jgi:hypothetical protein